MNIRQKYELRMLSDDNQVDMERIAELFSVHLRTVRYDIEILNTYLTQELGTACIVVRNKMAYVEETFQGKLLTSIDWNTKDFYTDRLSSEERMLLILFDLCWSSTYSTIQELADKYFVSRATVNKDIVSLKDYCKKNNISFVGNRGRGLCIEADEIERRRYLAKIIRDYTALQAKGKNHTSSDYAQWFLDEALERIKSIVLEVEDEFSMYLADVAYEALVIHIALSVERFRTKVPYGDLKKLPEMRRDSIQYQMADEMVQRVNRAFQIQLDEMEIYYVALHIGAKSSIAIRQAPYGEASLEYYCVRMISDVSRQIGNDLTNDKRLYENLLQHMNVCMYRKQSGMLLENPLKEELIHSYPKLYQVIRQVIQAEMAPEIIVDTEDEIAYILLHFATALYRREQNAGRLADVVVVCATGMGTAELVVAGLRNNFQLNIKGAAGAHQLESFLKGQEVDLIISTVPLQTSRSFVRVSPILRRNDVVKIGKELLDMGFDIEKPLRPHKNWSNTALWLEQLLEAYSGKEQEELLKSKIQMIPKNKKEEEVGTRYMLSELLNEQCIRLDTKCVDWEDSIWKSGELLIEKGDITEAYIQAVIDSVNEVGPYIVITKGVALPHATNKIGVNRTAMSFIRLHTPVNFGSRHNDPVRYIFMLATTDADSHLGALQDLAEFLDRQEFMSLLETAQEPKEIVSYIQSNESST